MKKPKQITTEDVVELKEPESKKETKTMSNDSTILELDMNLADYDDFEPLPNGGYPGQITKAEMRTSDKGNDYYYITFNIHPDDFPADYSVENAPDGMNLVYARIQKPDPRNRRSITAVKSFMRALGIDLKTSVINPGDWEGRKAKLIIKKETYNEQPINSIVSIEALD